MTGIYKRVSAKGTVSYQAKVRVKGYPLQTATFERKTDAQHWAQRIEADLREDKYFPAAKAKKHTISELVDQYLENLKATNNRRHGDVRGLLEWWKIEVGHIILSDFRGEHVLKGQQKLLGRKRERKNADGEFQTLSPATVNRYTVALHTAVAFGIKPLKWVSHNPVKEVDKLKEPPGRTRFLKNEVGNNEIERLLKVCKASKNPHLFAVVLIGIATGMRRKEIERLKWPDLTADCTRVTLTKTKNGEIRAAHLTGAAKELILQMRERRQEGIALLFPSPNNPEKPIDFESAWRHAMQQAKLEDFRFHDLRHTCGSYLAMNGATLLEIAEVLGHKSLNMVRRYAHLTATHTSNVLGKMTEGVLGHVKI